MKKKKKSSTNTKCESKIKQRGSELGLLLFVCSAGFLVDGNRTGVGAIAEEDDLNGNIVTREFSVQRSFNYFERGHVSYRYLREYGLGRVNNAQTMSLCLPPMALRTR